MVEKVIVEENIVGAFMLLVGIALTFETNILFILLGYIFVACGGYYIFRYYELKKNKM